MQLKIIAVEQAWLDGFNNRFGATYRNGEIITVSAYRRSIIQDQIEQFNHKIAQGNAINIVPVLKK